MNIYTLEICGVLFDDDDDDDDDEAVFFVFKFLHTHTVNTSYITIYVCEGKLCRTKILWVLKFEQVGEFHKKFQNPPSRMIF